MEALSLTLLALCHYILLALVHVVQSHALNPSTNTFNLLVSYF